MNDWLVPNGYPHIWPLILNCSSKIKLKFGHDQPRVKYEISVTMESSKNDYNFWHSYSSIYWIRWLHQNKSCYYKQQRNLKNPIYLIFSKYDLALKYVKSKPGSSLDSPWSYLSAQCFIKSLKISSLLVLQRRGFLRLLPYMVMSASWLFDPDQLIIDSLFNKISFRFQVAFLFQRNIVY